MKKILLTFVVIVCLGGTAWSYSIAEFGGTSVGAEDLLLGVVNWQDAGYNNAEDGDQTTWVNSILLGLGTEATFDVKLEEDIPYYAVIDDGVGEDLYALSLVPTPPESEYFLLKNGNYWALYQNNVDMAWAVFDAILLPDEMNAGEGHYTISHVSRYDGTAPVPEPATFMLLGGGLVGLAFYRRRRK